jgi:hypothetical protein
VLGINADPYMLSPRRRALVCALVTATRRAVPEGWQLVVGTCGGGHVVIVHLALTALFEAQPRAMARPTRAPDAPQAETHQTLSHDPRHDPRHAKPPATYPKRVRRLVVSLYSAPLPCFARLPLVQRKIRSFHWSEI